LQRYKIILFYEKILRSRKRWRIQLVNATKVKKPPAEVSFAEKIKTFVVGKKLI